MSMSSVPALSDSKVPDSNPSHGAEPTVSCSFSSNLIFLVPVSLIPTLVLINLILVYLKSTSKKIFGLQEMSKMKTYHEFHTIRIMKENM